MADNSFLMQAKGIDAPNPLDMAAKGLTLGDLYQKNQAGQLALDTARQRAAMYADPAFSQLFTGGANGTPDMSALGDLMSRLPLAAPEGLKSVMDYQKQQADIHEANAKALAQDAEAMSKKLTIYGNYAAEAAKNPTPQLIQGALRQHGLINQAMCGQLPPDFFGPMPALGSTADQWAQYFNGVASVTKDENARLAAAKQMVMLPLEAAASQAGTAKTLQETKQMPEELAVKKQVANTGSYEAATQRAAFLKPTMVTAPGTNQPSFQQPGMGGQMQMTPAVPLPGGGFGTPAAGMPAGGGGPGFGGAGTSAPRNAAPAPNPAAAGPLSGGGPPPVPPVQGPQGPVTFGLNPAQIEMNKAMGAKVAEMADTLPVIHSAQMRFISLKDQMENEKVLNGPLFGSEGFKEIAGIVSALPGMPPQLRDYVANTQFADASALSGMFNLMGEGKGTLPRSTTAMEVLRQSKPGTQQYKEAMIRLTNALLLDLNDRAKIIDNFSQTVQQGGIPKSTDMPSISRAGYINELTPATAKQNPNIRVRGPNGIVRSNGVTWVPEGQ